LKAARTPKTGRPRWVTPPPLLFERVFELVPRDDRTPARPVFQGFGSDRYRMALARACNAARVPTFSPHDLRHRRVSLLHLAGVPWARIGEQVGHDDLMTTARRGCSNPVCAFTPSQREAARQGVYVGGPATILG
jgi:integrase